MERKIVKFTTLGESRALSVAAGLLHRNVWFAMEPSGYNRWTVSVEPIPSTLKLFKAFGWEQVE